MNSRVQSLSVGIAVTVLATGGAFVAVSVPAPDAEAAVRVCQRIPKFDPIHISESTTRVIGRAEVTCIGSVSNDSRKVECIIERRWGIPGAYRWVNELPYRRRTNDHDSCVVSVPKKDYTHYRTRARMVTATGRSPWWQSHSLYTGAN